jgi:hypothetical protein
LRDPSAKRSCESDGASIELHRQLWTPKPGIGQGSGQHWVGAKNRMGLSRCDVSEPRAVQAWPDPGDTQASDETRRYHAWGFQILRTLHANHLAQALLEHRGETESSQDLEQRTASGGSKVADPELTRGIVESVTRYLSGTKDAGQSHRIAVHSDPSDNWHPYPSKPWTLTLLGQAGGHPSSSTRAAATTSLPATSTGRSAMKLSGAKSSRSGLLPRKKARAV